MNFLALKRKLLCFALLLVFLSGCGELRDKYRDVENGFSKVTFNRDERYGEVAPFVQSGGLMIYIVGQNSTTFVEGIKLEDENETVSVEIPNGDYRVYALSWAGTGPSPKLTGQVRCGFGENGTTFTLDGSDRDISVDLTTNNCQFGGNTAFSDANFSNTGNTNFRTLVVGDCTGSISSGCTLSSTGFRSAKVILPSFQSLDGVNATVSNTAFLSQCISFASNATLAGSTFDVNLPVGASGAERFILTKLESYTASSECSGAINNSITFSDGIINFNPSSNTAFTIGSNDFRLYY